MQILKARTIKAKSPLQTKIVFWTVLVGSRGATNRIRFMLALRKRPRNTNQLSIKLGIEYKGIQHHLKVLEGNNLVKKIGNHYGVIYCVSTLFENNDIIFDEIVDRLQSIN